MVCGDAFAHSRRASAPVTGIPIPSVSHGEMAILAGYRSDIIDLAARVGQTDPTFRRIQNHATIQYSYCFWGIAPGAVRDEDSPFNECAHAYLAAAKALILHMRTMANADPAVERLVSTIDADMVRAGAAFIGCEYSGETFSTAEFLTPHWENVFIHKPTGIMVGGLFFSVICLTVYGVTRRRIVLPA